MPYLCERNELGFFLNCHRTTSRCVAKGNNSDHEKEKLETRLIKI